MADDCKSLDLSRLKKHAEFAKKNPGKTREGQAAECRKSALDKRLEEAGASTGKPKKKKTMADAIDAGIDEADESKDA